MAVGLEQVMMKLGVHGVFWGACSMAVAIMLGAFGAHGLRSYFAQHPDLKPIYETAVLYQMIHGLALLLIGHLQHRKLALLMLLGHFIFSGSLYLIVFTQIKVFGAITPVGGVLMIFSWLILAKMSWGVSANGSDEQQST